MNPLCKMQDTGLPAVVLLMIPKLVNESVTSLDGFGGVDLPEAFKGEISTWPEKPKSRLKTFETASFYMGNYLPSLQGGVILFIRA